MTVSIEAITAYTPPTYLPLDELARGRGVDPAKYEFGLGCRAMALAGPQDDAVTMAANAAYTMLEKQLVRRRDIGLLVVGTSEANGSFPLGSSAGAGSFRFTGVQDHKRVYARAPRDVVGEVA